MTAQRYQAIFDWFRARPAALRAALCYNHSSNIAHFTAHFSKGEYTA